MNDDRGSGTEVAIGFSYSVTVGDGRSLVAQTHVPQDWTDEEINRIIDKLRMVADRQVKFGKIQDLEAGLDQLDKIETQLINGIEAVDKKVDTLMRDGTVTRPNGAGAGLHQNNKRATQQLIESEATARKNALVNLEMTRKDRAKLLEKIEAQRAELG